MSAATRSSGVGGLLIVLLVMIFGFSAAAVLISQGYVAAGQANTWMSLVALGAALILVISLFTTRSKLDDIIAVYILVSTLGAFLATYLISRGMYTAGMTVLLGIGGIGIISFLMFQSEARSV